MVLPKDPIKREEALKNIKEAAIRRSQNIEWRENNRKSQIGKKHSEKSRRKMSESRKGKFVGELNPMFGKEPWNKGIPMSEDAKKKLSKSNTGKKRTEEVKQKISEFRRELWKDENYRKNLVEVLSVVKSGEGNEMYGKEHSKETKDKMSASHKGKMVGDKNPAWNGGITPLRKAIRESTEMYAWKQKIMERDKYSDANTGERGNLEVHHIIPFEELLSKYNITTLEEAKNCKELWDIDNGITMLYENHRKFHGLHGKDDGE